jgi:hypothetical protein
MTLCVLEPAGDHRGRQDSIIPKGSLNGLWSEEPVRPLDANEIVTL